MRLLDCLTLEKKKRLLTLTEFPFIQSYAKGDLTEGEFKQNLREFLDDSVFKYTLIKIGLTQGDIDNLRKISEEKRFSRRQFLKLTGTGMIVGASYYADKKYRLFHRASGLFDKQLFNSDEINRLNQNGVLITIDDGPCIHNQHKDLRMQEEKLNLDINSGRETLKTMLNIFLNITAQQSFFGLEND